MSDYVIDVRDLRKSFGDLKVVEGLNLQVAEGEICGFLGANGSGKTTTIRMLCGLLDARRRLAASASATTSSASRTRSAARSAT